jgi:hypothetical protein
MWELKDLKQVHPNVTRDSSDGEPLRSKPKPYVSDLDPKLPDSSLNLDLRRRINWNKLCAELYSLDRALLVGEGMITMALYFFDK